MKKIFILGLIIKKQSNNFLYLILFYLSLYIQIKINLLFFGYKFLSINLVGSLFYFVINVGDDY